MSRESSELWVISLIVLVYAACIAAAAGYAYYTKKSKGSLIAGGVTFLCVLGADIASFVDPHNVVAWGALSVMSLVVLGASAATWKYYPDENGNRENVPLVPLGACSLVVFLVQLVAIITIEVK